MARDSISARPSSSAKRIAGAAPGLRARPSHAADMAFPCARPQTDDAIAIAKPDVIATQLTLEGAVVLVCAKTGVANSRTANVSRTPADSFFIDALLRNATWRWLPDILLQPASRAQPVSVPLRRQRRRGKPSSAYRK